MIFLMLSYYSKRYISGSTFLVEIAAFLNSEIVN